MTIDRIISNFYSDLFLNDASTLQRLQQSALLPRRAQRIRRTKLVYF